MVIFARLLTTRLIFILCGNRLTPVDSIYHEPHVFPSTEYLTSPHFLECLIANSPNHACITSFKSPTMSLGGAVPSFCTSTSSPHRTFSPAQPRLLGRILYFGPQVCCAMLCCAMLCYTGPGYVRVYVHGEVNAPRARLRGFAI
ncbi:hypothetical protein K437DRAFT_11286 [Tilletiaria anomala UBC 951]|uniref:Secreted protein n=1 Tax=Tilletiaria anomala (strain ATCC 24038 / CBS 436.72 / UBC 951) TaxID=1037660 RepID=A0A066VGN8_TILAU|nr:uncharacterized protein K437DRAFT_11286 [Tilletiaria anomala UBC 951]KDN39463.1 hypothetical protein K437DRAFT_11286 [Tilletiaria anomala UBC 951]